LQLEDVEAGKQKLKALAQSVNVLAAAIQARADERAKDMTIVLDPLVDQDAIQAMRRHFPDNTATVITFDQYKSCKEEVRLTGEEIGKQFIVTSQDVQDKRDEVTAGGLQAQTQLGGFNTPEAKTGGLRPELNRRNFVIPPIDIERLQIDLICILVNFIWKNFLKPLIVNASPPVSWAFKALPDQVCNPGGNIQIPDLFVLGDEPPDILTGKNAPQIPTSAPEI
jgi:hypothetical protein